MSENIEKLYMLSITFVSSVLRMAGPGPGAILAGGVFAVSRLVWQWSVVAEVFSLNNLFVGILFSLLACFHCAESVHHKKKVLQSKPFGIYG